MSWGKPGTPGWNPRKGLSVKPAKYCRCGHAESRHYHDQSDSRNGDNACPICESHGVICEEFVSHLALNNH